MKNINIDHKVLAKHFHTTNENMRLLKKKHDINNKKDKWVVYIKAYNYDTKQNSKKG